MTIWNNLLFINKKARLLSNKLALLLATAFISNTIILLFIWFIRDDEFLKVFEIVQLGSFLLYAILIYIFVARIHMLSRKAYGIFPLSKTHQKYEKTGLSESFSLELKDKLEYMMDSEKLYLRHELRLDDIAELLDISRHHASQVINENFNLNFYDFVNAYRIEEAKAKLCVGFENSSESISDIAYQCGFNNRVSFYKAFKKITHTTPTEFMMRAA